MDDDAPPQPPAPASPSEPPLTSAPAASASATPPPSGGLRIGEWPFGIVAVAVLRLLDAGALLIVTAQANEGIPIRGLPVMAGNEALTVALNVTYAVLVVIGVIGLLLFRRWGWVLTMVLVGLALVGDIVRFAVGEPAYVGMLLHVIAAFYLNGRSVRALAYADADRPEPDRR